MVLENGKTDIVEAVVGVEDSQFTCSCKQFGIQRKMPQKKKRSRLSKFCRHCFFVSHVILKRDAESILDYSCNDKFSSFFVVHDHFDIHGQIHKDQSISDLVWCPVCEQLLLKSELESYRDRNNCVFHCSVFLKIFLYYKEKKQQMNNKMYLSNFGLFKDKFIQDISDMDPLMINHWGLLHILVDFKDKSIIFNDKAYIRWQLYLAHAPPGMGINSCLDIFVFDWAFLTKTNTELVDFYTKTEPTLSYKNTFIWKYSPKSNHEILKDRFKEVLKKVDASDYEFVFHATNLKSATSISKRLNKVSTKYATDLGPGFYCGPDMDSCIRYALAKDGRVRNSQFEKEYAYVAVVCFAVEKKVIELEIQDDNQLKNFIWSNRMGDYDHCENEQDLFESWQSQSIKSKTERIGNSSTWDGIELVDELQYKYDAKHYNHLDEGLLGICIIGRKLGSFKSF